MPRNSKLLNLLGISTKVQRVASNNQLKFFWLPSSGFQTYRDFLQNDNWGFNISYILWVLLAFVEFWSSFLFWKFIIGEECLQHCLSVLQNLIYSTIFKVYLFTGLFSFFFIFFYFNLIYLNLGEKGSYDFTTVSMPVSQ